MSHMDREVRTEITALLYYTPLSMALFTRYILFGNSN